MTLRQAWDENAEKWINWARKPGHDSYWRFHGRRFLELVPPPGRLTLDVGCGEGRLGRDLRSRGHNVVGVDSSPTLAAAAATYDPSIRVVVGDASALPFDSGRADLVVAFMSLQDVDDLESAVAEIGRVLEPGGRLCMAIVHPINSAGRFESGTPENSLRFVISGAYLDEFAYVDEIDRDGLPMTFHSRHRTIESYSRELERSGFFLNALREVTEEDPEDKWFRVPLFLHISATKSP